MKRIEVLSAAEASRMELGAGAGGAGDRTADAVSKRGAVMVMLLPRVSPLHFYTNRGDPDPQAIRDVAGARPGVW